MFQFTIKDVGLFLGKSPATIRSWERRGLVTLPRVGTKRILRTGDIAMVAHLAYEAGRIDRSRLDRISIALSGLKRLETK